MDNRQGITISYIGNWLSTIEEAGDIIYYIGVNPRVEEQYVSHPLSFHCL